MNRDHELTRVLSEFAHTLGTDFSLQAILDRLVLRVVDLLPVTAAGVMIMDPGHDLHFVAASDAKIREIEALQQEFDEGPCLEAYRTGHAVLIPDLGTDERFARFSPHARAAGIGAVFTFPLGLDEHRLGALDLYRDAPGDLSLEDRRAAQVLADVAAAYLLNAQARKTVADDLAFERHRGLHDPLTGLPNRELFTELLQHAVGSARRTHTRAAVVFVDLDRFKQVNNRLGHHVGDLMLRAVSGRLAAALRQGDTLARFAGDEFVILCEDLPRAQDAEIVAARVSAAFAEPFDLDGHRIAMTASVGVAVSGAGHEDPESLLRDADFAMYQAKDAGGAHHRVVDRTARAAADEEAVLAAELPAALEGHRLALAYQPICTADEGALIAVEALLRWHHPVRGWVPPDVAIPVAERTGLILPLGRWVLLQACTDFMRWRATHQGVLGRLAVNVSARQVMAPALPATVAEVLAETGMDPTALHLEVTESVFLDDAARARSVLAEVKDLGVRLSMDDFGTGYSSLTYLKRFPFDDLKIDRELVADLADDDPTASAIIAAVMDLSHALDLTVVAEGVETQRQLATVAELGGDLAQGFYLSRPLSTAELERQVLDLAAHSVPVRLPASDGVRVAR